MGGKLLYLFAGLCAAAILTVFLLDHRAVRPPPREEYTPAAEPEPPEEEPPPEQPSATVGVIRGEVLDAGGQPVAGATVLALELGADLWPTRPDAPRSTGETDRSGRFWFSEVPPGRYLLIARSGTHRGYVPLVGVAAGRSAHARIRLLPQGPITGRVIDEQRIPVADALVTTDLGGALRPFYNAEGLPAPPLIERVECRTDASGNFSLAELPESQYDLRVSAPGFVERILVAIPAPVHGIDIELSPARSIRGTVEWTGGTPPQSIRVWAEPAGAEVCLESGEFRRDFVLTGLVRGRHRVLAWAEGFEITSTEVRIEAGREPDPVVLLLQPGTPVSGRVTLEDSDVPVADAKVCFYELHRTRNGTRLEERHQVSTDGKGRYRTALWPGRWMARVAADGYRETGVLRDRRRDWSWVPLPEELPGELVLEVGTLPREWSFEVGRDYRVKGRVTCRNGTPAIGVEVSSQSGGGGTTDADGRYEFPVDPGRQTIEVGYVRISKYGLLWPVHSGRELSQTVTVGPEHVIATADFVVPDRPTGRIRGFVADAAAKPVPNAIVMIAGLMIEVGPDGRYQQDGIPAGDWIAIAFAPGCSLAAHQQVRVKVGAPVELPEFLLRPWGVVARGRVLDHRGDPVAGAVVRMRLSDRSTVVWAVTDAMGRYEHYGAEGESRRPRLHSVSAVGLGPVTRESTLDEIVLSEPIEIWGTFAADSSRPDRLTIGLLPIQAGGWPRRREWVTLDAELQSGGRFVLRGIEPGKYQLRLHPRYHLMVDLGRQDLKAGESLDLDPIKLTPGGAIEGVLVHRRAGRSVELELVGLNLRAIPDQDGYFRFEHVPAGTVQLRPRSWESGMPTLPVVVEAGKTAEVEFVLSR